MVIKTNTLLHRILWSLPMWIPIGIEPVRVGNSVGSHVRIYWRV